ncbi:uncharacterized protein F5891DRAFT_1182415 [Suillus fuscotomentosus]|uniref:Uncharacterized protein n=1 Tax=Suillus fuscotomentosus TaxID=1912939 RepID=A0AAD4HQC1_9AGAM|nr:uncharacterized protein F5891DRAFT_1182415 [Suillus fuscotomentosus]KAG1906195.1 hypothetical protein F5891DRAFT_1182415 [Suillus fuscotomentosus]
MNPYTAPSIDDEPGVDAPGAQAPGSASSMSAITGMSGGSTSSTSAAAGTSGDVIMSGTNTITSPPPLSSAATRPTISTTSSTGKRSHNATSMFHDDVATFASTVPSSTSELPQQSEARASKKQKSRATQSRADSGQSAMMTSAARAAKITPAAAVVGMQGSINRLTDVIEKNMVTDAERLEKQRHTALHILNGEDADYYLLQERVIVMHMFADDPAVTDIYLQNDDKDMRYAFIQHMIQYRFQKVPQAPQVPYVRLQL